MFEGASQIVRGIRMKCNGSIEHATDQVLRPLRNSAPALPIEIELRLPDLFKECLGFEWRDAAQQDVENNPDGPYVRSFAVPPDTRNGVPPLEYFWSEVLRRAAVRPKPIISRQLGARGAKSKRSSYE